ncbi:unnamed protein product [Meloidogyne enterolobii]|uniref:Uncharacterized protein n=2 Tax=Meloidogyne enterolobii TaxID=390850 RepID=A0ACB0XUK4_MELEN
MICYFQMFILLTSLFLCFGEIIANGEAGHNNEEIGMEKRMLSYADLMNNFGGPSALDLAGQGLLIDDERPKREQNYNNDDVHIMTLWKRSPSYGPSFFNTAGDLTKKDDFIAPGVLRFGKRMPGVWILYLNFIKEILLHSNLSFIDNPNIIYSSNWVAFNI